MLYPHPPYCSVEPLPDVELGRRVVASGTWNSDMKGFPADPWNSFEIKRGNGKSSTNGELSIVMLDYQSVPPKKINKIPWTANAQVKWMRDVQPCHLCQIISCLHHTKVRAVVAGTQLNCLNVKGILWIQMVEFRVS